MMQFLCITILSCNTFNAIIVCSLLYIYNYLYDHINYILCFKYNKYNMLII